MQLRILFPVHPTLSTHQYVRFPSPRLPIKQFQSSFVVICRVTQTSCPTRFLSLNVSRCNIRAQDRVLKTKYNFGRPPLKEISLFPLALLTDAYRNSSHRVAECGLLRAADLRRS